MSGVADRGGSVRARAVRDVLGAEETFEACREEDGRLRLLESVDLGHARRVLITFLDDQTEPVGGSDTALLSETALADDWERPEEDAAWQYLQ